MLSCKEASQLVSQSLDRPLSFGQRLSLRLHLLICKMCHQYAHQLRFLQRVARHLPEHLDESEAPRLSDAAKQRIRRKLDTEQHQP